MRQSLRCVLWRVISDGNIPNRWGPRNAEQVIAYRGLSTCRICRENNGFKEFYAAGFCWPEGLAHYLDVHHLDIVASTPLAEFAGAMQALASTLPPPPPASSVSKKQPAKHLTTDPKKAAASKTSSRT